MNFLDVDVAALHRAIGQRVVVIDDIGHEDGILEFVDVEGVTIAANDSHYAYDWSETKAIYIVERRITPKGVK